MNTKVTNVRRGPTETGASGEGADTTAKANAGIVYAKDANGRKFGLKKLRPSDRFQLEEATQTKTPSGEMQAIFAASVISIDDEGMTPITSRQELLKRLDEIGDDGLSAITPKLLSLYGLNLTEKDIEASKN